MRARLAAIGQIAIIVLLAANLYVGVRSWQSASWANDQAAATGSDVERIARRVDAVCAALHADRRC